ncbi:Zn-ribbon domain-containing OB-fold protein [Parasphingorhabdus sp.]|jgi:uncharacterized protein
MSEANTVNQPVAPYTELNDFGEPRLIGSRCGACDQVHLGKFENCPKCAVRGEMNKVTLSDHGELYNYTIVHRSLPGVTIPFISAVVDLDGGGTVRGNLLGVEPDPASIEFGMPVKVVFRSAADAVEGGAGYIAHFFVPEG